VIVPTRHNWPKRLAYITAQRSGIYVGAWNLVSWHLLDTPVLANNSLDCTMGWRAAGALNVRVSSRTDS
jgi:hypothetical protein